MPKPNTMPITTGQFLDLIHGPDAQVYFQVGGKTWKNKPQTFHQAESTLRWRNSEGDDVCFIVNSGGTKDAEINRFNAVFVDWDCGKDDQGRYLPDDVAGTRKALFFPELHNFTPKPSLIVETRNGFHAYWLLEAGVTVDQFRDCQRRLAVVFGGDPAATNPARLLRLPGFDWVKASAGCARFHVQVIHSSAQRYRIDELLAVLPQGTEDQAKKGEKAKDGRICAHNKCSGVYTTALIVGPYRQGTPVILPSAEAAIEHLKQQNLGEYLGLAIQTAENAQSILCPFHQDTTPSATLYRSPLDGHWLFKCHSSLCGVEGTILDIAQRLIPPHDQAAALRHLFQYYGITIDTGWKEKQKQILEGNILILQQDENLKKVYPHIHQLIRRILGDLIGKLRLAQQYVVSERSQHDGHVLFFASLRHFHRVASRRAEQPRYFNRQNEKVDRYCLLGLMNKLSDDQVPRKLLEEARKHQVNGKRAQRIQFYTIPAYTPEVLKLADDRARVLIQAGASVRGISFEMIRDLFGGDMAVQVYPQGKPASRTPGPSSFCGLVEAIIRQDIGTRGVCNCEGCPSRPQGTRPLGVGHGAANCQMHPWRNGEVPAEEGRMQRSA
jgi:hypothetical protein